MSFAFKFGTAGIRARLGAGPAELNLESVRAIASAILEHLAGATDDAPARALCVAFDGRLHSRSFADEVCRVALERGFWVRLFERETPTPVLAFSVRASGACAGIMVTASHNPAHDNGIKVYLSGGRQLSSPDDGLIEARIAAYSEDPASAQREGALRDQRLQRLGAELVDAYLQRIVSLVPLRAERALPRIAYGALYGVGTEITRALFRAIAVDDYAEVAAQTELRSDFGGLESPNPEEPAALAALHALAEQEGADVAFAHDPDADRLAVLARDDRGVLRALTGDEVGALLGDFLLAQQPEPSRALLVSTLVSGGLLESIARAYSAHHLRTPTGFKWIAAHGRARARRDGLKLLFGYEEALGYAFFDMADDKDGIAALAVTCALLRELSARGRSLIDQLHTLERTHGVFSTRQLTVSAQGAGGGAHLKRVSERLRAMPATSLLGPQATLIDYEQGTSPFPLLVFSDPHGTRVCARPSGTEPKLKLYLQVRETVAAGEQVETAHTRAEARLALLEQALSQLTAES